MAATLIPPQRLGLAGALLVSLASSIQAQVIPPPAYQVAVAGTGVPSQVLYSVALQESGTPLRGQLIPWPWTLNVAGRSLRFKNRSAACSALLQALRTVNPRLVDVGLGQVNIGWNGHRFKEPCEGLDPYRNLAVTAEILQEHKQASGSDDWIGVAGRYHRPAGGAPAARYRQSFAKHLTRVAGGSSLLMANNP
ncbi:lytic transglycosylase domain-containing protein [Azotobacter salinestris]|uniref:lytic transglycosylase domain-containing protein n=1 Tax=Azotobacter salinestris TaxID=69964 RepID=UPI0032E01307